MSLAGMRVLSLESRRAKEIEQLIRKHGGEPFVAPSMREAPLERNDEVFRFAERLFRGEFDMMIFLTGVGVRFLNKLLATRYPEDRFAATLRNLTVVARGSKPVAALREMNVPVTIAVPEPNTWREVLSATEGRPERRVAVQEYGRTNDDLLNGLRARGAEVTAIRAYEWDLPEDTGPLREAARRLAAGDFDIALFTTSVQVEHLLDMVIELGIQAGVREALGRALIASVGPTTSETLRHHGIEPDFEPSHPKMGFLVQEVAKKAAALREAKGLAAPQKLP
jgi:uroporphyrinogen-III synthase